MTEQVDLMFLSGAVMGLSGGLAPGPLTTLVLSHTLMYGRREGIKAALAPLITDGPIILFSMWLLGRMAGAESLLGAISLVGALVLFHYGVECIRFTGFETRNAGRSARSLWKGVSVNLLNPHPYLFWSTVGSPIMVRSLAQGWGGVASFLAGFYGALVGAKVLLATVSGLLFGRGAKVVLCVNRGLGLCLWVLAAGLAWEGLAMVMGF